MSIQWASLWAPASRAFELEQGSIGWEKIQSIFAAVRMLGGSIESAYAAEAISAVVAAVLWIWTGPQCGALKAPALATATLRVTPYVLDYDLIVPALPIAWLCCWRVLLASIVPRRFVVRLKSKSLQGFMSVRNG